MLNIIMTVKTIDPKLGNSHPKSALHTIFVFQNRLNFERASFIVKLCWGTAFNIVLCNISTSKNVVIILQLKSA